MVVYDRIDKPLHFDSFINIGNKDHEYVMDALMIQQWLIFHWYGEDFKYKGSTGVGWSEENRKFVKAIWEKGIGIVEGLKSGIEGNGLGLSYDECMIIFDIVKEKWVKENPLN